MTLLLVTNIHELEIAEKKGYVEILENVWNVKTFMDVYVVSFYLTTYRILFFPKTVLGSRGIAKNNAIRYANFAIAFFFLRSQTAPPLYFRPLNVPLLLRSPMLRFSRLSSIPFSPFISHHFQSSPIPTPIDFVVYHFKECRKKFWHTVENLTDFFFN